MSVPSLSFSLSLSLSLSLSHLSGKLKVFCNWNLESRPGEARGRQIKSASAKFQSNKIEQSICSFGFQFRSSVGVISNYGR